MPALGALLYNIFAGIVAYFVKYLTQKTAFALALVTLASGLMAAIYLALRTALYLAMAGVGNVHPMFAVGIGVVISPTTQQFITAYFILYSACELYKWKFNIMQLWARTI